MSGLPPFHLAIPVNDIASARKFHVETTGCAVGCESDAWIDFDFFGHQLTAHVKPEEPANTGTNPVDGENVPVRHFGIVMHWEDWQKLSGKPEHAGMKFLVKPTIRFRGRRESRPPCLLPIRAAMPWNSSRSGMMQICLR